jgi:L-amino acid N-acyltransferase YncA
MSFTIDPMRTEDWEEVRRIYVEGIATGNATFETEAPAWATWDAGPRREARLGARDAGWILGWGALSSVSDRCVYGGVAEVSVYVGRDARGRGIGRALLEALARDSEAAGIWTLQAGIFPENENSIAVHKKCGFRIVGLRERLGKLAGAWRDVLLLERRSTTVGGAGQNERLADAAGRS